MEKIFLKNERLRNWPWPRVLNGHLLAIGHQIDVWFNLAFGFFWNVMLLFLVKPKLKRQIKPGHFEEVEPIFRHGRLF